MLKWFFLLSAKQRIWMFSASLIILAIVIIGIIATTGKKVSFSDDFSVNMSIRDIAPKLGVTGKSLARELGLDLNVPKNKPLNKLGIKDNNLEHVIEHLISHKDATLKYYIYLSLVLGALVFLIRLGRPDGTDVKDRKFWYPRTPYIIFLLTSLIFCGFILGKSPNPMEGVVKVFKSMVGLYPDPIVKLAAFLFFLFLAIIGNKLICGWGCPFGALQELIYIIPMLKKIKKRKLPFWLTNSIRGMIFITMLLLLFGIIYGKEGMVIYHYVNPFNLFNFDFEYLSILITIIAVIVFSFGFYRPFCQFICPFGFVSWLFEKISLAKIKINYNLCTQCGSCVKACPLHTTKGIVEKKKIISDCFSCARCLNVCSVDAIRYKFTFKK